MDDSTKRRGRRHRVVAAVLVAIGSFAAADAHAACDPKSKPASFEQFKACTYQEADSKIWIVDGDVPVVDEEALRRFYDAIVEAPPTVPRAPALGRAPATLIVNRVNDADDVWGSGKRCGISYCVSRASTGARYQQVVDAMAASTAAWSSNMGVKFVHAADQDGACAATNAQVDFDVQVVSGQPYLARAFFPAQSRATRNVNIDTTSFSATPPLTLEGVLRHELGHAIGFRHEHTRPEAGQCFEDNSWRALTPYDSASVMHYPQCGGTAGWLLALSPGDVAGGAALYGATDTCTTRPAGAAVTCRVFNDGYASATGLSDALYFRANNSICVPDTTTKGTCRKWFGRCQTPTGERVNFTVFDDGPTRRTAPSDAVTIRRPATACTPGGTGTANCRKWVGLPATASGKPAKCYLFDDGYARVVGPTDAIYAKGPNQMCMPDGSPAGTCRRWFGRCQLS